MLEKYGAALISILLAAFAFLRTAGEGLDAGEAWQLVAIVAGSGLTFAVPLVPGPWAGALKTGLAGVAALATAVVPFVLQGMLTLDQMAVVALAVLTAIGVQVGVSARVTQLHSRDVDTTESDPEGEHALKLAA